MLSHSLLLLLLTLLSLGRSQSPEPIGFPARHMSLFARNTTNPSTGVESAISARQRWYNWALYAQKMDCNTGRASSSLLHVERKGWIFNEFNKACATIFFPVNPVSPTWPRGGTYLGIEVINGAICHKFEKELHYYYEVVETGLPQRVISPEDDRGNIVQDDYGVFPDLEFSDSVFEPPEYCANATMVSFRPDGTLDLSAFTPSSSPDPANCFGQNDFLL